MMALNYYRYGIVVAVLRVNNIKAFKIKNI